MTLTSEQQEVVMKNHGLIYFYLHKNNLSIEDYYDLAAIGLCKAVLTYEKHKGAFSTYAFLCMQCEIATEKRKFLAYHRQVYKNMLSLDTEVENNKENTFTLTDIIPYKDNAFTAFELRQDLQELLKDNPVELEILKMYYLGFTQKEISKKVNISQSYISRLIRRIGVELYEYKAR